MLIPLYLSSGFWFVIGQFLLGLAVGLPIGYRLGRKARRFVA